ncbi:Protein of unknown function [Thermomonospora echinospora]|uniref:DUF4240 domain-containing protein n=1 Tax=Thermomonospora echinospora TaxID=1992 RepID=A0A1H5ZVF5_9ACTN|nr:DUF4240 domain-containing protein [Thermomonospora echinospora]SEG40478.1 Protein of unknown function [Thermomonospora echinospora]
MDIDIWWGLVERARRAAGDRADDRDLPDDPLPDILTGLLYELGAAQIIDFDRILVEVMDTAYRYPLWNAAYLIEGGCGDDGFMDFRAGLVLQGRAVFTQAVADPDSLAGLPVVARMGRDEGGWIGCEGMNYVAVNAYERLRGERESFDAAMEAALRGMDRPARAAGESWDPEDEDECRRRLPRLSALFLDS